MDTSQGMSPVVDNNLTLPPIADAAAAPRIDCRNIKVFYGEAQAIHDVSISFPDRAVTSMSLPELKADFRSNQGSAAGCGRRELNISTWSLDP